jgi:hypothetical protein
MLDRGTWTCNARSSEVPKRSKASCYSAPVKKSSFQATATKCVPKITRSAAASSHIDLLIQTFAHRKCKFSSVYLNHVLHSGNIIHLLGITCINLTTLLYQYLSITLPSEPPQAARNTTCYCPNQVSQARSSQLVESHEVK